MSYFDASGMSRNMMEDNDETVAQVAEFLKRAGVEVFYDYVSFCRFAPFFRAKSSLAERLV